MSEAMKMRAVGRQNAEERIRFGVSGSTLKLIAVFTMLIDHTGAALVWRMIITNYFNLSQMGLMGLNLLYMTMRLIGRVAFPIYCYMLVEGYTRTRSAGKYALRLFVFALLSEVPFDLAFSGDLLALGYQNVFFTLLCGLLAMMVADWLIGLFPKIPEGWKQKAVETGCTVLSCVVFAVIAKLLKTDYDAIGVCCIMIQFLFRKNKKAQLVAGAVSFLWEFTAPLAFIPLAFYNGKRGLKLKYFFYLFYPVHLLILFLICLAFGFAWTPVV